MEILQIVTSDSNTPAGTMPRAEAIKNKAWCRSTNIFVVNSKGQILCHKRSEQKERFPGVWFTHLGGHVGHDESYESNALKELKEEAGINHHVNLIPWRTTKLPEQRLWVREFAALVDLDTCDLVAQPGEVDEFAWKSIHEIIDESNINPGKWKTGTHDIVSEYQCLRAVITAASSLGAIKNADPMHTWHPPLMALA